MVAGIVRRFHSDGSIKDGGSPLIGLTTKETVKFIKTRVRRPSIVRSGDGAFPRRSFMVFAECSGAVAVESQHLGERRHTLRTDSGIAGKSGSDFHDGTGIVDVVIASR